MQRDTIHALSFCFEVKMVEPASSISHSVQGIHHPWQHVIEATVMKHPCMLFCTHWSAVGQPNDNTFSGIPKSLSSSACHCPVPSCATVSLIVTLQSFVISTSTFCSLHSMLVVLGQPLQDKLAVCCHY